MHCSRSALAVLAPLLLAACGGSSSSPVIALPTTSTPAPSSSASPSPAVRHEAPVPAEHNPPGDIPDNLAFVPYSNTAGRYRFTHPEGWAEQTHGADVLFTDKLNGVTATTGTATSPPTTSSARQQDMPALRASQAAFELRTITAVSVTAGRGVRIVYRRNSAPDAVTGRQYRDEVERYELVSHGREVVLELYGPVGSDNVDAYRTMLQSLRIG